MGEIRHIIRRTILTLTLIILCAIYVYKSSQSSLNADGTIYLVDEFVDVPYEELTDNTGYTTINGISNVFINMKSAGYDVYKSDVTNDYIDVVFVKENCPSYRYYFTYPECKITVLSSDYETSYLGVPYIIEDYERSLDKGQ